MNPIKITGDLPNGGAYALLYFQSADGGPSPQESAVRVQIFEYDEKDNPIAITFLDITNDDNTDTN